MEIIREGLSCKSGHWNPSLEVMVRVVVMAMVAGQRGSPKTSGGPGTDARAWAVQALHCGLAEHGLDRQESEHLRSWQIRFWSQIIQEALSLVLGQSLLSALAEGVLTAVSADRGVAEQSHVSVRRREAPS